MQTPEHPDEEGGGDIEGLSQAFPGEREGGPKGKMLEWLQSSVWSPFLGDRPGAALTFSTVEVTEEYALLCSRLRPPEQAPNPTAQKCLLLFSLGTNKKIHTLTHSG